MINSILNELIMSLPSATFILEILALIIALYFKKHNVVIITLLLLSSKVIYLFSSAYQVNIFVSLFMPLMFSILLTLKKEYDSLKSFLPIILVFCVYIILGIFLPQNTTFMVSVTAKFLNQNFAISDLSLVFFGIFLVYLCALKLFNNLDKAYFFAYFGALFEFIFFNLFEKVDLTYFEFASLVFLIAIGIEGYKLAFFDALTKVLNRRAYDRLRLINNDILCVCDIDFFKKVNDTYGHDAGDFILKEVAKILKKNVDKVYRFGGEEFIIAFKNSNLNTCVEKLDNIRKMIENEVFVFNKTNIKITISMGVSVVKNDKNEAFKIADSKLYEAKKSGRNRVIYE